MWLARREWQRTALAKMPDILKDCKPVYNTLSFSLSMTAPASPAAQLAKSFEPADIEARWYAFWEQSGCFASGTHVASTTEPAPPPFVVQFPPPNVTGTLHMGHAFNQTIMDGLVRYHRMRGADTAFIPGTDHAGIATQIVVERQLDAQGISRHDLGRDKFLEKVWDWKAQSGSTITAQFRRLGSSADWAREYFTMDAQLSRGVVEAFVRLFEQGLIYRGKRLVNWDPVLGTAVSDLEVVSEEEDGQMWEIRYPLVQPKAGLTHLVVATTRPETLLGDVAVMVHPEDERYAHLIGQHVWLPLCERHIPIIADAYVDPAFGTGVVKVTPAHDFNDYAVGQRHQCLRIATRLVELLAPLQLLQQKCRGHRRIVLGLNIHVGLLAQVTSARQRVAQHAIRFVNPRGPLHGEPFFDRAGGSKPVGVDPRGQRFPEVLDLRRVLRHARGQAEQAERVVAEIRVVVTQNAPLDCEGFAATAGGFFVRVGEAEPFVDPFARVVEFGAVDVRQAFGVDEHFDAKTFVNLVVWLGVVDKFELVRQPRAAGGAYAQPQAHAFAALLQSAPDVAGGAFGQGDGHESALVCRMFKQIKHQAGCLS